MSKIMVAMINIEDEQGYLEYQNVVLPIFLEMGIESSSANTSIPISKCRSTHVFRNGN